MSAIPLILCERNGRWADALRQELAGLAVRLVETRSLHECLERLAEWPAASVGLELTETGAPALLALLVRLEREFPQARPWVFAERKLAPYGDLLREAGAIHFAISTRQLAGVVEMVRRCLPRLQAGALSVEEQIMAELPWENA